MKTRLATVLLLILLHAPWSHATVAAPPRPNIVFIMADDLGYGDLGCYGQKLIQTPQIDRLAAQGMRFTQFYAGSTVCAPSRSVLMTGLHAGHTRVRGNAGARQSMQMQTLRADDVTVARVLQKGGYATALIGKWGLGEENTAGEPRQQGFDYYFGYLNQKHAHNHYPAFLWRNGEKVPLPNVVTPVGTQNAGYATKRVVYAGDLFAEEACAFIERNRDRPFFLYFASTIPHANNEAAYDLCNGAEVPSLGIYRDKPWPNPEKGYAAMISHLDGAVGLILERLTTLGLDERTVVIFTSDNGPEHIRHTGYDPAFFNSGGPLRGVKRAFTEGGIRVPFIARWPGRIAPGSISSHVGYLGDMMATFAGLAGATLPPGLDSLDLAPTLLGRATGQARHPYLYWEYYEGGGSQAVLMDGRWKGIRAKLTSASIQLFDLAADLAEGNDLAEQHPEIVARIAAIMREAHVDNEHWKF